MSGWMVTVAVLRNDDRFGHEMYAVAISDVDQAVKLALKMSNSEAAVVNGSIDEAAMNAMGLKPGQLLKMLDETTDPLTSRTRRH